MEITRRQAQRFDQLFIIILLFIYFYTRLKNLIVLSPNFRGSSMLIQWYPKRILVKLMPMSWHHLLLLEPLLIKSLLIFVYWLTLKYVSFLAFLFIFLFCLYKRALLGNRRTFRGYSDWIVGYGVQTESNAFGTRMQFVKTFDGASSEHPDDRQCAMVGTYSRR